MIVKSCHLIAPPVLRHCIPRKIICTVQTFASIYIRHVCLLHWILPIIQFFDLFLLLPDLLIPRLHLLFKFVHLYCQHQQKNDQRHRKHCRMPCNEIPYSTYDLQSLPDQSFDLSSCRSPTSCPCHVPFLSSTASARICRTCR